MQVLIKGPPGPTEISPTVANDMRNFEDFRGIFGFANDKINSTETLDQNLTRISKKMENIIKR